MKSRVNFTIYTAQGPVTLRGLDWSQSGALQTICVRYGLKHYIEEVAGVTMKTDPTRRELMRALQPYRATLTSEWGRDGWDMARESAIYWFGYRYHGGQWSNLYSVLSTSPYRPGPFESGPEVDEGTMCLYDILEGAFRNEN